MRLQLLEGGHREGRLDRIDGEWILLRGTGSDRIPRTDVRGIWTRGSRTKVGALAGGGIGLVGGAVIGAALGEFVCAETSDGCTLESALATGAIGAGGGAGIGALVGLLIPRWKQRWP